MIKTGKRKTLDNTRFYIKYSNGLHDETTLSFRTEDSMKEHIDKHKISKDKIKYDSKVKPRNPLDGSLGLTSSKSSCVSFMNTTRRGLGG